MGRKETQFDLFIELFSDAQNRPSTERPLVARVREKGDREREKS